jgi:hypothetical protein
MIVRIYGQQPESGRVFVKIPAGGFAVQDSDVFVTALGGFVRMSG